MNRLKITIGREDEGYYIKSIQLCCHRLNIKDFHVNPSVPVVFYQGNHFARFCPFCGAQIETIEYKKDNILKLKKNEISNK